jgi:hypothetical protein
MEEREEFNASYIKKSVIILVPIVAIYSLSLLIYKQYEQNNIGSDILNQVTRNIESKF